MCGKKRLSTLCEAEENTDLSIFPQIQYIHVALQLNEALGDNSARNAHGTAGFSVMSLVFTCVNPSETIYCLCVCLCVFVCVFVCVGGACVCVCVCVCVCACVYAPECVCV